MAFVVINYGDNQQKLFNPDCRTRFLIDNIKERCNYPKEMDVELSDDQGNVKNIWQSDELYANSVLNVERENLILLEVKRIESKRNASDYRKHHQQHRDKSHEDITYVPLLNNEKIVNSKFTARLSSRDETSSHRGDHRTPRRTKDKKSKEARRSMDKNDHDSVIPHPNTPSSNRKRGSGSRTPSSSRSKSRGKQR